MSVNSRSSGAPAPFAPCTYRGLLRQPGWWLAGISVSLLLIDLWLIAHDPRMGGKEVMMCGLAALALASSLWEKRHTLALESGVMASGLGVVLIAVVLLKGLSQPEPAFLFLIPVISGVGLGLLAFGFRGFGPYRKELLILGLLSLPALVEVFLIDLCGFDVSRVTARVAATMLQGIGYDASVNAYYVGLPAGGVTVITGCSGIKGMIYLLRLALLFVIVFPPSRRMLVWLTPLVAITIAFSVNAGRVALLAVLASQSRTEAFDYWHVGHGSSVLGTFSTLLLALFCFWLLASDRPLPGRTEAGA